MDLKTRLEQLREENQKRIKETTDLDALNQIRVNLLGKKSPITEVLRGLKNLDQDERPKVGAFANQIKADLQANLQTRREALEQAAIDAKLESETIDVTLPGDQMLEGTPHILDQIMDDIEEFFIGQGYQVVDGPEVEEDHYNFEMLNIPKDHPARDMQDTFYIDDQLLMRSQTSPVQARTLEVHDFSKGPLKMISPGRVYRRDTDDATHSHQFHQVEGLVIDKHITMADLKGTLLTLAQHVFGADRKIRLRPSYFPFTEPSVEVDVSCFRCNGKGCAICKYSGWIEVLGAGMVHPNVLTNAGVDADVYGGFAFGLGPDRFAMLKYGIDDIRSFYQGDLRFLTQFKEEG
ncbi:MAG: phenylalanine--tRNA ligase subunit alpha [Lactobacillus sp.]|uniref:Phenylalanine--tRNA ligase alpha subunit n=4 Tax=Lacticaseibacillus TaxID=2759736 RepID=A0ABW4BGT5_9LACO|nr:phenylalanine--tRNA ligase subunit alpha [Lacticaseibacillus suilingensis]MCI1894633.1 phenylalanine--tRNA ligase subunit alpha [Lactobacillus sp.]MCI1917787.1 phenylalanine--tRNA ligase subunit alpha [Lactobacillus sp.]MCI1940659.1 phenylalanine--tRNA ligase subunit alpha [Lactobacillus sp.]MCI1971345.1 phenylalanine--tRNA ligase subunit alpha [Lactobacillus sp.]MCI2037280.1 phenylalanine--tRNA ligase subunit alpha [Lactobacillus sp.]